MNKWSQQFNVPFPQCHMCGQCCKCASPSISTEQLIEKARQGDPFSRDFLSIFIPYDNLEQARKVSPSIVEKSLKACDKPNSKVSRDQVVFYHCKFLSEDNRCSIHEDRPQLCRDYPDMPFLIFADGCSFEPWAKECRQKYKKLQEDLDTLKKLQESFRYQQQAINKLNMLKKVNNPDYRFCVLVPDMCMVSPAGSWIKKF